MPDASISVEAIAELTIEIEEQFENTLSLYKDIEID